MSKRTQLSVAVIGVGNMGRHHARVYSEFESACLVAVADKNKEIGQGIAEKYNCKYYMNYRNMLNSKKIDAASICVPTSLHKDVAIECIERGIPVLIEKPIADSIASAERYSKGSEI